jgi:acetyltransferase-like isoleucine patch superfamily enzyme
LKSYPATDFLPCTQIHPNIYSQNWGEGCQIFPQATVSINTEIKDFVLIYHNCVISHDSKVESNVIISNSAVISGNVHINENTYIGANATILEGIRVGKNCIIAAGSTVTRDVPDNHIYYAPQKVKENNYMPAT